MMPLGETMRYLKPFFILFAGVLVVGVVILAGITTGFGIFLGPSGTIDEAAVKVRSQRDMLRQIIEIARRDPALAWVEPDTDIRTLADVHNRITPAAIKDYDTIGALMRPGQFRSLAIQRDGRHELKFVRFVVFDFGWFGRKPPVLAEWSPGGSVPWHDANDTCKAAVDGWYVCTDDD